MGADDTTSNSVRMFCVKGPTGELFSTSIALTKLETRKSFTHGSGYSWRTWAKAGYKIVPVDVVEALV